MDVILLERVEKLGTIGDEVTVKNGFARNYLLPQGKALIANDQNRRRFEAERAQIEARNEKARSEAAQSGEAIDGMVLVMIRQAGETGQLYGSVTARDICDTAAEQGHKIERRQVNLNDPIKSIGMHEVQLKLHAEVSVSITVNVARSPDEAERQAAGEDVIASLMEAEKAQAEADAAERAEAAAEMDFGPADEA